MKGKRGISAIIATVLIVLVSVVAVAIIWTGVILIVGENLEADDDVNLEIVTHGGYTFCDFDEGVLSIQVDRGADEANLSNVIFMVSIRGNSVSYSYNSEGDAWVAPEPNSMKVYALNVSKFIRSGDDYLCDMINEVSVIPVFDDGSRGLASTTKNVRKGRYRGDDPAGSDCESDVDCDGGICQDGICECLIGEVGYEGDCAIEVNDCMGLNIDEQAYILSKGFSVPVGGFPSGAESCFDITADDIVFDLNGKEVNGDNALPAIKAKSVSGIEIKNGKLDGFKHGIELVNVDDSNFNDLTIVDASMYGINLEGTFSQPASDNSFENLNLSGGGFGGLSLDYAKNNYIKGLWGGSNDYGIQLYKSEENSFEDITLTSNKLNINIGWSDYNYFNNFYLGKVKSQFQYADHNEFTNGVFNGSSDDCGEAGNEGCGVYIWYSAANKFTNVSVFTGGPSTSYAFYIRKVDSKYNKFTDLTLCGYSYYFRCPKTKIDEYYRGTKTYCKDNVGQIAAAPGICP